MARAITALFFFFVSAFQPSTARELIPVEHFARLPALSGPQLSPDGTHVAGFIPVQGLQMLLVMDLDPKTTQKPFVASFDKGEFRWVRWVNNERLIASMGFPRRRNLIPVTETRLIAFNRDGSKQKPILKQKPFAVGKRVTLQSQIRDRMISILPRDDKRILLSVVDKAYYPEVLAIDVYGGKKHREVRGRFPIGEWIADYEGVPRIGVGYDSEDLEEKIVFRLNEAADWQTIHAYRAFEDPDFIPLGFGSKPNIIYVASNHATDTLALYEFDAVEKRFLRRVFEHKKFDISGLELSPNPLERRVVGVRYVADADRVVYFDEEAKALQAKLDGLLPNTRNDIVSESWNGLRIIVMASSDIHPPIYYVMDRRTDRLQVLGAQYTELRSEDLVPIRAVSYKAKDGLEIPAFLSFPKSAQETNLPTVIMPHGGPYARSVKTFDYWTQFLTSRGYLVLRPNFRGSTGYGMTFQRAGYKEWGLSMQDDLADGAQWLIEQGIADPNRICIFGGSYGGYAALMGAVKTPELYRCAISLNGVTDLVQLHMDELKFYSAKTLMEFLNDKRKDNSPLRHVDKIKAPVLLAHGENDRSVYYYHSSRMADALKSAGKTHEFLTLKDGDHHLSRGDNRLAFFKALDAFLAKHLGPGAEPEPEPEQSAATAGAPAP